MQFEQLNERLTAHAKRADDRWDKVDQKLDAMTERAEAHAAEDREVERRVHDIEIARKTESDSIHKRSMVSSGLVSAVVGPATAWLFRKFFGL